MKGVVSMKKHTYVKGEHNSWKWLADLAIGEESAPLRDGRTRATVVAKRIGVKITTRTLHTGDFIVKRIA
jgi:3-dehydroquinate synthase class II